MSIISQGNKGEASRDAAYRIVKHLEDKSSFVYQMCKDKLVEHKQYITEYGQDLEEIRNWKW